MPYTIRKVKNGYKVCKKNKPSTCFSKKGIPEETAERQKKAIEISEMEGGLKPLTARIGGKVLLKKKIVEAYFPKPDSYTTYVEPFVGGGSIFFYANKDEHKEVVNDIDPDIYTIFKGFKDYPASKISEDVNGDYTEKDFEEIKNSEPTSAYNKFLKTFLQYRLSYFGRGLTFGKPRINSNFKGYQERLKDADIYNKDYKEIIKKYNKPSTFYYLDPPARESSGSYRFSAIDIPELLKMLKTIKGKFLLSIANIDVKKEIFRPYRVITVPTKYVGKKQKGGQTQKVKEYLIMNYDPRMEGSGFEAEAQMESKVGFGGNQRAIQLLQQYGMSADKIKGYNIEVSNLRSSKADDKTMNQEALRIGREIKPYVDAMDKSRGYVEGLQKIKHNLRQILDISTAGVYKTGTDRLAAVLYFVSEGEGGGTHRENVLERYKLGDKGYSLEELSEISSVPMDILQEVYNRGIGAYKTNPQSVRMKGSFKKGVNANMSKKLSKEQWAMARVYSFLDGNDKHDNDLRGGGACNGCMGACGGAVSDFQKKLDNLGLYPMTYLNKAKELAKHNGYDPAKVLFCDTGKNKLMYMSPDGLVHFGNPDYYDYIIYSWLESQGEVEEGTADERRDLYRARATHIKGNWKANKYSPNNLAINILW